MLKDRIMSKHNNRIVLPEHYKMATDDDFSGTTNGSFKYIGTKEYVIIPEKIKGVNVTSYSNMFAQNKIIKGVANLNKNITNMYCMFYYCPELITLDCSNLITDNVTTMQMMFYSCSKLVSLNVSNFKTSKVTNMDYTIGFCTSLTSLDLGSFDMSKVTTKENMLGLTDKVTTAYARTASDANLLSNGTNKPTTYTFAIRPR